MVHTVIAFSSVNPCIQEANGGKYRQLLFRCDALLKCTAAGCDAVCRRFDADFTVI